MVLFKDEEQQIKEQERALKPRRKVPVIIKVLFVFFLLICGGLFAVSKQEGNSETLRSSLESYLKSATGMTAEIGTLNNMAFFPNVKLDAEDISLVNGDGTQSVTIDKIDFKAPFMAISMSKLKFHRLNIEGFRSSANLLTQNPLTVSQFAILDPETTFPQITATGQIGEKNFNVWLELAKTEKNHGRKIFHLAPKGAFQMTFEDLRAKGHLNRAAKQIHWELDGSHDFANDDQEKQITVSDDEPKMAGIKTVETSQKTDVLAKGIFSSFSLNRIDGHLETGKTKLQIDLSMDKNSGTTGKITSPALYLADIPLFIGINDLVQKQLPSSADFPLSESPVKIDLLADNIMLGSHKLGRISAPLSIIDSNMHIGPLRGELGGGKLSGTYKLEAAELPATLSIQTLLTDFNYAQYQSSISDPENKNATLNLSIEINGQGHDYNEIYNKLNGHIHLVAAKGHMRSTAFDIWTGGLLGALLPSGAEDSETVMNCALANFEIENGIGTPSPFFIDTDQATIIGEGEINFGSQTIDLAITPKLKETAILDISTPVNIDGALFAPSISPSAAGLGKVLGSVLLGVLNPATLLVTMNDLGLSETHPCREFLAEEPSE